MGTVTKSIGSSSRDYSTITLWEADLDNAAVYASGDHAVGECYNDSAFDESVTINGGGTVGLASVTLTVASGERHDGTAGSGARIVTTSGTGDILTLNTASSTRPYYVDYIEISTTVTLASNSLLYLTSTAAGGIAAANRMLIHGKRNSGSAGIDGVRTDGGGRTPRLLNSVIYDIRNTNTGATSQTSGVRWLGTAGDDVFNVTVHSIVKDGVDGSAYCFDLVDDADFAYRNLIGTDASGGSAAGCFKQTSFSNATASNNLSSDTSASGTGSLTNKAAANQFVSTVSGSEDLHLKLGADAIDAGTDLGTTPTGVNYDIDGRDRDAQGDTWDIGADEYVAVAAGFSAFPKTNTLLRM